MFSTLKKVISFITLATTLIVAIRELKNAVDSIRKHAKETSA